MKINISYVTALLAVLIIGLWFLANTGSKDSHPKTIRNSASSSQANASETRLPSVVVEYVEAKKHPRKLQLYGRTEANRRVQVKAETAGIVNATPVTEGRIIGKGTVLCRQDIDARKAMVDQAKANLKSREFDLKSTQILVDKGYRSAIQLENLKAQVDGALATVKQAEIELDNVNMRAPFKGVFATQLAEIGDYLGPGQPCGLLMEMNPLIIAVDLTESQVGAVKLGQDVDATLATGETVAGKVRFVEPTANPSTRTFRTEISVANPKYALKGGVTATVSFSTGETLAQRIPARILSLDDSGEIGVRYLDQEDIVRFAKVETIDEDLSGVWVTGLPDSTRIIVHGQDFVSSGTKVKPTIAMASALSQ